MKLVGTKIFLVSVCAALLCGCNNFFHELVPPNGGAITSFEIPGQQGTALISRSAVSVTAAAGTDIGLV